MPRRRRIRDLAPTQDFRSALGPLIQALSRPAAYNAAVALGVVLTLPSLFAGFAADDQLLRATALGHAALGETRAAFDHFRFFDGGTDVLAHRLGLWSVPPDLQISLLRPLSSLTHAFDHWLWPAHAWTMHAHNILWYGLLIGLAGALYRNFLGAGWIAAAATLLFAVDDAHGAAVGVIANRHYLIAACLACITIAVHDRHRRDGWEPGLWVGPAFFALTLAVGEHGLATLGYLVAYAIVFDDGTPRDRVQSLAPFALAALAWDVIGRLGGYGVAAWTGSVDPATAPLAALGALVVHLPVQGLALIGLPWAEGHGWLPAWAAGLHAVVGAAGVGATYAILHPLLRNHRVARFFALGAALSLVPGAFIAPHDAQLLLPSIGFAGLLAQFIAAVVQTARAGRLESLRVSVLCLFLAWIFLHVAVAPLLLPLRAIATLPQARVLAATDPTLPDDAKLAEQQLVIVNAPDLLRSAFTLLHRANGSGVLPASARVLSVATGPVEVWRATEDVVLLSLLTGVQRLPSPPSPWRGTRERAPRFREGDRIDVAGFVAEIDAIDDVGATRVRFRFDVPCDNPSLRWVTWDGAGYVAFTPPEIGSAVVVGAASDGDGDAAD